MMRYSISTDIYTLPSRVWAVMKDVERWHEWTASISSIQRLDGGPFGVGSRVRIRQPNFPPAVWQVTGFTPDAGFVWVSHGPGLRVQGEHRIEATAQGSRVTLAIEYEGPIGVLLGRLTRDISERYIAIEAAGLKARSES